MLELADGIKTVTIIMRHMLRSRDLENIKRAQILRDENYKTWDEKYTGKD